MQQRVGGILRRRHVVSVPRWLFGLAILGAAGCVVLLGVLSPPLARAGGEVRGPAMILYSEENFGGRYFVVTGTLFDMPKEELEDGEIFYWNDNVRSIRVLSGTWRLCQHGRLNTALDDEELSTLDVSAKARSVGWAALVSAGEKGPGEYPSAAGWGWAPDISSIELVSEEVLPEWARKALPGN